MMVIDTLEITTNVQVVCPNDPYELIDGTQSVTLLEVNLEDKFLVLYDHAEGSLVLRKKG